MAEKIEGMIVLDGLIEGPVPDVEDGESRLKDWVRYARSAGLHFSLEIEGDGFSLLAENAPLAVADLGEAPAENITDALQRLLDEFPPPQRANVLSTVRSTEYRPGEEVQTVYAIGPGGRFESRQRVLDAETARPPEPVSRRDRIRLALAGLLAAAVVLLILSFFFSFGDAIRGMINRFDPYNPEEAEVDASAYADFLEVSKKEVKGEKLILRVKRKESCPKSEEDYEALFSDPELGYRRRLAAEALAKGYIRAELFDKEGKFLAGLWSRVAALREKDEIELAVPVSRDPRLGKVVLTY